MKVQIERWWSWSGTPADQNVPHAAEIITLSLKSEEDSTTVMWHLIHGHRTGHLTPLTLDNSVMDLLERENSGTASLDNLEQRFRIWWRLDKPRFSDMELLEDTSVISSDDYADAGLAEDFRDFDLTKVLEEAKTVDAFRVFNLDRLNEESSEIDDVYVESEKLGFRIDRRIGLFKTSYSPARDLHVLVGDDVTPGLCNGLQGCAKPTMADVKIG